MDIKKLNNALNEMKSSLSENTDWDGSETSVGNLKDQVMLLEKEVKSKNAKGVMNRLNRAALELGRLTDYLGLSDQGRALDKFISSIGKAKLQDGE